MVHLTFIRCAEMTADESISRNDAQKLFLLTKTVVEQFGKPQMLYCADSQNGILSAQVVNLACGVHGIHASTALNPSVNVYDAIAFIDFLAAEARNRNDVHIVMIGAPDTFRQLLHLRTHFGISYTLCANSWVNILHNYSQIWSPFELDKANPEMARELADKLFNHPCSADEMMLIERSLKVNATV